MKMKCNVKDQDGRLRKTRKLGLSLEMPFFFCPPPPLFLRMTCCEAIHQLEVTHMSPLMSRLVVRHIKPIILKKIVS